MSNRPVLFSFEAFAKKSWWDVPDVCGVSLMVLYWECEKSCIMYIASLGKWVKLTYTYYATYF